MTQTAKTSPSRPRLLRVDLTVSVTDADFVPAFAEAFHVETYTGEAYSVEGVLAHDHEVICFDFDYPHRQGLRLMQQTKLREPSRPLLMHTLQHSEALAIWAFRTRIWDYLVKPISKREAERCIGAFKKLIAAKAVQRRRHVSMPMEPMPVEARISHNMDDELALMPAVYYVERHFAQKISMEDAAKRCRMSQFRFSRAFHNTFSITFQEYLLRYRVREACRLLENPNAGVSEVAYAVGFNDTSYFGRIFRRYLGVTPSDYRTRESTHEVQVLPKRAANHE